jgi:hypothetical protein
MGYRSDVAYKIKFEDEGQWNVFLLEAKSKPETRLCFEDESLSVVYDKQELRFVVQDVKWYEDYEDVKCHIKLFDLCDEYNERQEKSFVDGGVTSIKEPVVSYLFRRIGESEDDIEDRHGGDPDWDWVELIRYIRVDWEQ